MYELTEYPSGHIHQSPGQTLVVGTTAHRDPRKESDIQSQLGLREHSNNVFDATPLILPSRERFYTEWTCGTD